MYVMAQLQIASGREGKCSPQPPPLIWDWKLLKSNFEQYNTVTNWAKARIKQGGQIPPPLPLNFQSSYSLMHAIL